MNLSNFFEARFEGTFKSNVGQHLGASYFNDIDFVFLNIYDYVLLNFRDLSLLESYKTDDFLYRNVIKSKKVNQNNNISIFIYKDEKHYYSDNLYNVLLKNIEYSKEPYYLDGAKVFHVKGKIYFQLKAKKSFFNSTSLSKDQLPNNTGINIEHSSLTEENDISAGNILNSNLNNIYNQNQRSGFFNFLFKILKWLFIILVLYFIYKQVSLYFNKSDNKPRVGNEDLKINNLASGASSKRIKWEDFKKNKFQLGYNTHVREFQKSKEFHSKSVANSINLDQYQFYNNVFEKLHSYDANKIDFIVSKLKKLAGEKNYNAYESAELVVTFIQSIPYCLVHDFSCEKAIKESNSDFLIKSHKQGKPCLPNIPAGVQSPYEFVHNLKGDCDTRALLAFTILSKLNIPSSIWMSQQYGQSVIGIGVPSTGVYKTVDGVRHFATELTAEGYQIGMISPDLRNTNNWEIGTFNNF
jgi:hypothetical protein